MNWIKIDNFDHISTDHIVGEHERFTIALIKAKEVILGVNIYNEQRSIIEAMTSGHLQKFGDVHWHIGKAITRINTLINRGAYPHDIDVLVAWNKGDLSEGQASNILGLSRIDSRALKEKYICPNCESLKQETLLLDLSTRYICVNCNYELNQ